MIKILIVVLILVQSCFYAQVYPGNRGSFAQGWYSETINRDGRSMNSRIYYPSMTDGENAPTDTTQGPYPVVAFGHGFFMQTSYYISLYRQLASHGFIVIAPQFSDTQHGELGGDLIFCINHIVTMSKTPETDFIVWWIQQKGIRSLDGRTIWDWTDANGYINRNNQIYLSQKYLTAAFKLFLYEDNNYWKFVFGDSVSTDTSIILESSINQLPLYSIMIKTSSGTIANNNIEIKWEKSKTLNQTRKAGKMLW
ncbi:MAG: hypothetical protein IPN18_16235 [Ignavibacteriales bacterium]|nr:hypothetical protein [Ignavibacteriales bacterium]